jgi:hypothetical protein
MKAHAAGRRIGVKKQKNGLVQQAARHPPSYIPSRSRCACATAISSKLIKGTNPYETHLLDGKNENAHPPSATAAAAIRPSPRAAYDKCLRALQEQSLVTTNVAKTVCAKRTEIPINVTNSDGHAGPTKSNDRVSFAGSIDNKSADAIITAYQINLSTQNGKNFSKQITGTFIQPGESGQFYFGPDDLSNLIFDDFTTDSDGKPKWTWSIAALRGLQISPSLISFP